MEKFWFLNRISFFSKDQKGTVLVFSILVLIMVSLWGAATLTLSTNEYRISNGSKKAIQAYYVAEAGLEEGITKIRNNDDFEEELIRNLDLGIYEVSKTVEIIEDNIRIITITSVGEVDDYKKTLTAELEVSGGPPSAEDAEISYEGDFTLDTDSITGDIYVTGFLTVGSNTDIDGDIYAGEGADFNTNTIINGDIFVNGNLEFNTDTTITGNIYVMGDLIFNNHGTITGDIYLMGSLTHHNHFYHTGNLISWDGILPSSEFDLILKDLH